jgi:hypothetical protein
MPDPPPHTSPVTAPAKKRRKPARRRAKRLKLARHAKYLRRPELSPSQAELVLGLWDDFGDDMRGVLVRFVESVPPMLPEPLRLPTPHDAAGNHATLLDAVRLPDGCVGDGDLEFVWLNEAGTLPLDLEWRELSDDGWFRNLPNEERAVLSTVGKARRASDAQQLAFEFPPA